MRLRSAGPLVNRDVFVDLVDLCPNRPVRVSSSGNLIDVAAVRYDRNRQIIVIELPDAGPLPPVDLDDSQQPEKRETP